MQMGHVIDDAIPSVFVPTAKEYPHCRISGLRAYTTAAALYENLVFKFNCACAQGYVFFSSQLMPGCYSQYILVVAVGHSPWDSSQPIGIMYTYYH